MESTLISVTVMQTLIIFFLIVYFWIYIHFRTSDIKREVKSIKEELERERWRK